MTTQVTENEDAYRSPFFFVYISRHVSICPVQHQISAYLAAVAVDGNAHNNIGDAELAAQLNKVQSEVDNKNETMTLKCSRECSITGNPMVNTYCSTSKRLYIHITYTSSVKC